MRSTSPGPKPARVYSSIGDEVKFRVLGPLEVLENDEPLALGGSKQRALLALLLLNANRVVSTDRLIDELWGAEPPKTPAKSLQVLVSGLRKVLEPERASGGSGQVLVTRAPGYLLGVEPEQIDLVRFERLAADGRDALAGGDSESAAEKLREALVLWRGPPLADLTYADFAQREIPRLEELRLAVLEDRIEADLECGRHAAMIGELEQLVAAEPLRERPRAQLMLALYRSGRQAEALDAYRDARRALVEELGIEPGGELRKLEAQILEQDPALAPPAKASKPRQAPAGDALAVAVPSESFVGRESELAEFRAALEGAFAGRTSLFLIAGEPGIGKSRLADEAVAVAEARGATVLWGRCWEAGGAPAYWPWVQALRTYIRDGHERRIRTELEPYAADIAQMLPELNKLFPDLPPAPSLDPEGARFRLFDSTASFLRTAGHAQPIVLVLDDLHAADTPSLLMLQFIVRSLRDAHVLFVGAYRDTEPRTEELTEVVAEIRREPATHAIRLGGLDVAEVVRVIELTAGTVPSDELATAVHDETEGNPLFVSELVRLLASEGLLEEAAREASALTVPQGVREVIDHRLRSLSTECKGLLSVASVLGRDFPLDALARISEHSKNEVLDLLDEAQAARVVVSSPAGPRRLRFAHALIRDGLYGDLGATARLRLHRRTLEALENRYGADRESHLAELAHHSFEAAPDGDIHKAVDYAWRAGDRAARLLAYEEAARLYEMAREALALRGSASADADCELLLALGEAQVRGGDLAAGRETFTRAAELAGKLNNSERLGRAALGYGGRFVWFRAGKDRRMVPLLEAALEAQPGGDSVLRAKLLARLAGALRDQPVAERRASMTREAVEIARRTGDRQTLAYALAGTYAGFSWPKDADAWLAMARELTRLGEETEDKEHVFFGRSHALGASMLLGEMGSVNAELRLMTALAEELRQPVQRWAVAVTRAMLALFCGRLEEAEECVQRGIRLGARAQGVEDIAFVYVKEVQVWGLRRAQGRLAEVVPELIRRVEEYPTYFIFRCLLASSYAELGRAPEARAELARLAADDLADLQLGTDWFFGASLLAELCASLGDAPRAAHLYEALRPYARYNVYAHPEVSLGSASRHLGLLAFTISRWEEAERHFEKAIEMNGRMGARPWVGSSQHDYARMLIHRGTPDDERRACELLRAARGCYEELGMRSWVASATRELATIA